MVAIVGDVFKALADETRRLILDELYARDGQSLFELCTALTASHRISMSRQAISQHLAILEDAALISTSRAGRTKLHHLNTEPLRLIRERWPLRAGDPIDSKE